VTFVEYTVLVEGMTCAACAARIERALRKVEGVQEASVNLATERATVVAASVTRDRLEQAIKDAGYGVAVQKTNEVDKLRWLTLVSAAFSIPLLVLSMLPMIWPAFHDFMLRLAPMQLWNWIMLLLTLPVYFGAGSRFHSGAWKALKAGSADMNSLVSLGTGAAFVYSSVVTVWNLPGHVYFEAAGVVITLVLLGKYLEALAKGRTSQAMRHLLKLQPKMALLERGEVPVNQVRLEDLVTVRPGEQVAVDGVVVWGQSYIDESMVTGEPMPAYKTIGDKVTAGTLNQNGSLTFRAKAVGDSTVLAQIIRLVEAAQASKPPIQGLADRVVAVFTPIVLGIAVITALVWGLFGGENAAAFALVNAVAVLIIACPCAMGLATPTSVMVGSGRAAAMGVLFRKGEALQTLQEAQIVVLDKTGTLTKGAPEVTDVALDPLAWQLAASLEQKSEHPIAKAITEKAKQEGTTLLEPQNFTALPGLGISGQLGIYQINVGSKAYMQTLGVDTDQDTGQPNRLPECLLDIDSQDELAAQGKTVMYVAVNNQMQGLIAVADPIKPGSLEAIKALQARGIKVAMLTGDNLLTAQAIGKQLGIDQITAGVLPSQKAQAVQALKDQGYKVVFVGDGINDAPALASADVGIAIGTGTDIAMESAEVVLMSGDLRGVLRAMDISRATLNNIRLNLFWAFAYNVVLIPIAAGVLYPFTGWLLSPVLAGAAMGLSSLFVLLNALSLRSQKLPSLG
jgi:P-type Cu+ transporter